MNKFKRITKGSIDDLTEFKDIFCMGDGIIKINFWEKNSIILDTIRGKEIINISSNESLFRKYDFLEYAEKILKEKKMYLINAEYTPNNWIGFSSHKLKGRIYVRREDC